jgi:hypothetical protein
MKSIFLIAGIAVSLCGFAQTGKQNSSAAKINSGNDVPAELITDDSTHWTISTLSTIGYVNTTAGPFYNTYKSGGGMIVKFKFKKGNRFEFMLYVQANTYGADTETWTQVEGTVMFTKDSKGQSIFITKAEKGTYRITKNGYTTSRLVPKNELAGQHSCTYLWEKFNFPDDSKNTYLLVVDMEQHPNADINVPGSIDKSWVSKFHIPAKK